MSETTTKTATDPDGETLELGGAPPIGSPGRGPRCCSKARYITSHKGEGAFSANPGKYSCVCYGKSYCFTHGIRCNGGHD